MLQSIACACRICVTILVCRHVAARGTTEYRHKQHFSRCNSIVSWGPIIQNSYGRTYDTTNHGSICQRSCTVGGHPISHLSKYRTFLYKYSCWGQSNIIRSKLLSTERYKTKHTTMYKLVSGFVQWIIIYIYIFVQFESELKKEKTWRIY